MGLVALVIAIGLLGVVGSLALGAFKVVVCVVVPLFVSLIVGALLSNAFGPQVGVLGAVVTLIVIIATFKKNNDN